MDWSYSALTRSGQEIIASFVGSKEALISYLLSQNLVLIEMRWDYQKTFLRLFSSRPMSKLSLAVFFEDLSRMLEAGLGVSQAILILKTTSKEERLIEALSVLEDKLKEGQTLTEGLVATQVFPWIVATTLSVGERMGQLRESTSVLGRYFRSLYHIQSKLKKALIYPVLVCVLLMAVFIFISLRVIPQLKSFLPKEALHNPGTQGVLFLSVSLEEYGWLLVAGVILVLGGVYFSYKKYPFQFQTWLYGLPVLGGILKESSLALYLLNLSVLLKSGVNLLKALEDLNASRTNPVEYHFFKTRELLLGGFSFWQALEQDAFFPVIVPLTLRKAEEMVKLDEYCVLLVEYFNKRVASKLETALHFVQPVLLGLGGAFLVMIALGFLFPVYSSLTTIAEGQ
ncbi:MAG: type II secretion system F family protein [Candidatus Omnitrophica bacterium]|nr:type II secretion system F family protein [Candidatus Omnitrophota bacterium]